MKINIQWDAKEMRILIHALSIASINIEDDEILHESFNDMRNKLQYLFNLIQYEQIKGG